MSSRQSSTAQWPVAIILIHWVMAAALALMLLGGFAMTRAAHHAETTGDFSLTVLGLPLFDAFQLHKSMGVVLFAAVLLRLLVRAIVATPELPTHMPPLERRAARAAQIGLYALMFSMPITGWLLASSSTLGLPTVVFGLFELPHPIGPDATREALFATLHWAGAWALTGLAGLHTAAALKHHFIDRDNILSEMLPLLNHIKRRTDHVEKT
ncbi:cytochrome b [Marinibacterium sp. SX1]|uniref:cytochrome b n=1 Tax=Marinibacterium sp. SX1 TaxID=3388424 RepID=UPI003D17E0F0